MNRCLCSNWKCLLRTIGRIFFIFSLKRGIKYGPKDPPLRYSEINRNGWKRGLKSEFSPKNEKNERKRPISWIREEYDNRNGGNSCSLLIGASIWTKKSKAFSYLNKHFQKQDQILIFSIYRFRGVSLLLSRKNDCIWESKCLNSFFWSIFWSETIFISRFCCFHEHKKFSENLKEITDHHLRPVENQTEA